MAALCTLVFSIVQLVVGEAQQFVVPDARVSGEHVECDLASLLQTALPTGTVREPEAASTAKGVPDRSEVEAAHTANMMPGGDKGIDFSLRHKVQPTASLFLSKPLAILGVLLVSSLVALLLFHAGIGTKAMRFMCALTLGVSYACLFTLGYDVTVEHGGGAIFSGFFISASLASLVLGSLLGAFLQNRFNLPYRRSSVVVVCLFGLNTVVLWNVIALPQASLGLMLLLRLVQGVCLGLVDYWLFDLIDKQCSGSEVEANMRWSIIGSCVGMGIGPLMTSLGETAFAALHFDHADLMAASCCYCPLFFVLPTISVLRTGIAAHLHTGSDTILEAAGSVALTRSEKSETSESCSNVAATIVSGLVYNTLANFVLQSIEVGSAFLLEVQYGMSTRQSGYAVGISLTLILPVAGLIGQWTENGDISLRLRRVKLLAWVIVLGCLCFLPLIPHWKHRWLLIMLGDVIAFSGAVGTSSVLKGTLLRVANDRSKGSLWSTRTLNVLLSISFTMRSVSGPWTRALIYGGEASHQLTYAVAQISCSLCCVMCLYYFAFEAEKTLTEPSAPNTHTHTPQANQ